MDIQNILAAIEAEHSARRERDGGDLLRRNNNERIAEIRCLDQVFAPFLQLKH